MRILIAWELGENFGHVMRLLPIARMLRDRAHDVLFVVKDVTVAHPILQRENFSFVQAPVLPRRNFSANEIASYAEILALHGFAEVDRLSSAIQAWQHLYRLYQADVVVLDHAPTALFSARLAYLPTLQIAMGFDAPPVTSPYPCFRPWLKPSINRFKQVEEKILATLNHICDEQKFPRLDRLTDIAPAEDTVFVTFPEIDHYGERENVRYLGVLNTQDNGTPVEWPTIHQKNVFIYLRANASLPAILKTLTTISANVICVIPGITNSEKAKYETAGIRIYGNHLQLGMLLARCDLAVTHGGYGVVGACLLQGIPMLVVPTQIEQLMLSNCLLRLGTTIKVDPNVTSSGFSDALERLLIEKTFKENAQAIAARYQGFNQAAVVSQIADLIEKRGKPVQISRGQPYFKADAENQSALATPFSATGTSGNVAMNRKIALVTGAGRGIGAAVAKRLAEDGATVIVNYRENHDAAMATVQMIQANGGHAIALQADVTIPSSCSQLFTTIRKQFGKLDILVNNVGLAYLMPLDQIKLQNITELVAANIQTVMLASQEASQLFPPDAGGRIINVSSITSTSGPSGSALYGATKAAVEGFTRSLAVELGSRAITVNAVAPGQIDTDLFRRLSNVSFERHVLSRTPLGRLGLPRDVAHAVGFFASEDANWITGQILRVDGGFSY